MVYEHDSLPLALFVSILSSSSQVVIALKFVILLSFYCDLDLLLVHGVNTHSGILEI